jgi:hypothetical protein
MHVSAFARFDYGPPVPRPRLLIPFAVLALSCTHHDSDASHDAVAPPPPATSASAAAPAPPASVEANDDQLKPVYAVDAGVPDPLAIRLCEALDRVPDQRVTECCGVTPSATSRAVTGQCVRTLTAALSSKAITLAEADVARCTEAMTKATTGCDWVTASPGSNPLPSECIGILHGTLPDKARCRSSLECSGSLRCQGLSAIDVGTCGKPNPTGTSCALAIDTLATFTRQEPLDHAHPECTGYCRVRKCTDVVATGGACKMDAECGHGRCEKGACTSAPLPAVGQPCSTSCARGARCSSGTCTAAKPEGASCDRDTECRGSCVHDDGGTAGSCAKSCPKTRPLRK